MINTQLENQSESSNGEKPRSREVKPGSNERNEELERQGGWQNNKVNSKSVNQESREVKTQIKSTEINPKRQGVCHNFKFDSDKEKPGSNPGKTTILIEAENKTKETPRRDKAYAIKYNWFG